MAETGDSSLQRVSSNLRVMKRQEIAGVSVTATETTLIAYINTEEVTSIAVFLIESAGTAVTVKAYDSPDNGTSEVQIGSDQTLGASGKLRFLIATPGRYTKITGTTASGTATVKIWMLARSGGST